MRAWTKAGIAAGTAILAGSLVAIPVAAQEGDLNCGDPGTFHNMPVDPNNDPNNLDADDDGIGCEDPSVFDGAAPDTGGETPDTGGEAPPAEPTEAEPDFTG